VHKAGIEECIERAHLCADAANTVFMD
jgi:hypothetical protein